MLEVFCTVLFIGQASSAHNPFLLCSASFSNAFYGLLLYTFYAFVHPLVLIKGYTFSGFRASYITGMVVIGTALIQKRKIIAKHAVYGQMPDLDFLDMVMNGLNLCVDSTRKSKAKWGAWYAKDCDGNMAEGKEVRYHYPKPITVTL